MNREEIEELKDFTIDLTDIDDLALGLEVCSKKSNMVIQEFADTIIQLQQENKILRENAENNDKVVDKVNWENMLLKKENKKLKELIDTILNFSFFKEECPLNFGFENSTNEDKSQSIFYEDEWCENNCNDNYKDCWLKYFKKLQELEGSDSND